MKTMAEILRERGKLGPYGTPAQDSPAPEEPDELVRAEPKSRRPRKLPPVDF